MPATSASPIPAALNILHLETADVHFRRILVATDFSKSSEHALQTAIDFAEFFHAKLLLVHASEMLVFVNAEAGPLPADVLKANLDTAKDRVEEILHMNPRLEKLQPAIIVDYATPLDLIRQVTREEKIDLIIAGSHGASGIERLALGSVAESILRKSSCPVLIVGPNSRIESNPLCSILFATDLSGTGLRAAQYAAALAEGAHGKLTVLHVVDDSSIWPILKPAASCDRSEREQLEELLPADIREHCKEHVRVEYGAPAEIITQVAREECAGLVIVGLKDRSSLAQRAAWSTLSHIIRDLHCPVLGVRSRLG